MCMCACVFQGLVCGLTWWYGPSDSGGPRLHQLSCNLPVATVRQFDAMSLGWYLSALEDHAFRDCLLTEFEHDNSGVAGLMGGCRRASEHGGTWVQSLLSQKISILCS